MKPTHKDLADQIFNRLTAIKYVGDGCWLTKCTCGNEKKVKTHGLTSGTTGSCGCLRQESMAKGNRKHGMCGTKPYIIWYAMKQRCLNPNSSRYFNYGGRGITICDKWKKSFVGFWEDMSHGYVDGLSLDRIDVNGNYEPSNCRWVELWEQNNNQRSNIRITIDGKTLNAKQWSEEVGLKYHTIISRIYLLHWDPVLAVTTPKSNKWSRAKRK